MAENKEDKGENGHGDHGAKEYELIVNRVPHKWPSETITGAQIKQLAGSPADWVVNQIVAGPGEDPEVGNDEPIHLDVQAEPKGVKRFTTRKPSTSPGA
jgi:hypothetical protein